MATATAEKTAQDLVSIIQQAIDGCVKVQESREKLRTLKDKLALLKAELDQVEANAKSDVSTLADMVLSGDDLEDRETVFAKREALKQKVAAYSEAVKRQESALGIDEGEAAEDVRKAVEPTAKKRGKRLHAAMRELIAAKNEYVELQASLMNKGVTLTPQFRTSSFDTLLASMNDLMQGVKQ